MLETYEDIESLDLDFTVSYATPATAPTSAQSTGPKESKVPINAKKDPKTPFHPENGLNKQSNSDEDPDADADERSRDDSSDTTGWQEYSPPPVRLYPVVSLFTLSL